MSTYNLPTDPPESAQLPERHSEAPAPGSEIASHYPRCFGCGSDHPTGLHMQVFAAEGLRIRAVFEVTEHHQGAPGIAHGGLLAAAFDEALGSLNWLLRRPAVTARLETDFRRPVPVGEQLHIDGWIAGVSGRKVYARAIGHLGAPDGPEALTAAALFVQVGLEHFQQNGRAEDVQRIAAEQAIDGNAPWLHLDVSP